MALDAKKSGMVSTSPIPHETLARLHQAGDDEREGREEGCP